MQRADTEDKCRGQLQEANVANQLSHLQRAKCSNAIWLSDLSHLGRAKCSGRTISWASQGK